MTTMRILIFVALTALAASTEVEDVEQKKRGAGKTNNVNTIPSGIQKPDYTYSIYTQNPSQNNIPTQYSNQAHSSFYPSQNTNQYYTSSPQDAQAQLYPQQPQINLLPPPTTSQFLPFLPNAGYQSKYQLVPSKPNGHIQFAIIPQSSVLPQSLIPFSNSLFAPNSHNVNPQLINQLNPHYQPYNHQSAMLLFAPANPSLYNLFSNPYNYYQTPQSKYNFVYQPPQNLQTDYEKAPVISKEDNELVVQGDYVTQSEPNYKTYNPSRGSNAYKS